MVDQKREVYSLARVYKIRRGEADPAWLSSEHFWNHMDRVTADSAPWTRPA